MNFPAAKVVSLTWLSQREAACGLEGRLMAARDFRPWALTHNFLGEPFFAPEGQPSLARHFSAWSGI